MIDFTPKYKIHTIEIDSNVLDCILAIINPEIAKKSDLDYDAEDAKIYLHEFFKTKAKGFHSSEFIDLIFDNNATH